MLSPGAVLAEDVGGLVRVALAFAAFERGHKPRCCKVQIVFLVVVVVFVVVVFGVPNSLLL